MSLIPTSVAVPLPTYATPLTHGEVVGHLTVPESKNVTVNRSEVACWTDTLQLIPGVYPIVWRDTSGLYVGVDARLVESDVPVLFGGVRMTPGHRDGGMRPDTHVIRHSWTYQFPMLLEGGHTYERDPIRGGYLRRRSFGGFEATFHGDLEVVTTAVSVFEDRTHLTQQVVRVDRHHGHDPAHQTGETCTHGLLAWQGCTKAGCCRGGCFEPKLTAAVPVA